MKQYKKYIIFTASMFLFFSSLFASNELEMVWEHNYTNKFNPSGVTTSTFSSDLASQPDKILLAQSYDESITPSDNSITMLSLFEIDMNTGKRGVSLGIPLPSVWASMHLVKKYNDTLYMYILHGYPSTHLGLYKMRAIFGEKSAGFLMDPSYLYKVVDTSVKGTLTSGIEGGLGLCLYHNRSCGLIDMKFHERWCSVSSVTTEDTLTVKTLGTFDYFDDFDFGSDIKHENVKMETSALHLDSNRHTRVAFLGEVEGLTGRLIGLIFLQFDDSGKLLFKKNIKDSYFYRVSEKSIEIHYANNHVYILYERFENNLWNSYIRKYTLDGTLVKELPLLYTKSPELSKYNRKDDNYHLILRMHITDKDELYLSGAVMDDSHPYSFYISKYDANMNLVYEKNWGYRNEAGVIKSSVLTNILIKDGYVYVKGSISKNPFEEPDYLTDKIDNTVYAAKFKEPVGSIDNLTSSIDINLYPNPASFISHLSISLPFSCNLDISLCDLLGRDLFSVYSGYSDVGLFERDIVLRHLSSGVYLLKVRINDFSQIMKLIVK